MIGGIVIIVGDLAEIFGCLVGLHADVSNPCPFPIGIPINLLFLYQITAITFVALGTSLPDTFASKIAAVSEKTADNAIGNVTGSNSVNVFMGLGIPWMIASIYHAAKVCQPQYYTISTVQFTYYYYTLYNGNKNNL